MRIAILFLAIAYLSPAPGVVAATVDAYAPVLPELREKVVERTEGFASSYVMNLTVDPGAGTVAGTQRVDFINHTGEAQRAVPFRLYPNAAYYDEGSLVIERIRVDGERVEWQLSVEQTVLTVPLPRPLPPGGTTSIAMRLAVTVPADSQGTFGVFSRDLERGTWILADWYPILAGWEPGEGWLLDAPTELGDPTFSDVGLYDVTLSLPGGWIVVATGDEAATRTKNGNATWDIVSGPARELTLVLDDDFEAMTETVDGTEITVYTDGTGAALKGARIALDAAAESLTVYSKLFGPYPYTELDLVETEIVALGVSWAGVIFLNAERVLANQRLVELGPAPLRFTVAHEVGHQWWGSLVGMDSNEHPFLLEGLTNYLSVVAIERIEGKDAARVQLAIQCVNPYLDALATYGDGVADLPITDERTGAPLGVLIYGKAALGFLAIRQGIGDSAFFAALDDWSSAYAFRIATPDDLLAAFESASGQELDELWRFWFQAAETGPDDVYALLDA